MNEKKTRVCKVPEGEFDFLGYTFGRMYSARTGQARIGYRPSKKSIQRGSRESTRCQAISWANYFSVGAFSKRVGRSTPTWRRGCAVVAPQAQSQAGRGAIHSRTSTGTSGSYA